MIGRLRRASTVHTDQCPSHVEFCHEALAGKDTQCTGGRRNSYVATDTKREFDSIPEWLGALALGGFCGWIGCYVDYLRNDYDVSDRH